MKGHDRADPKLSSSSRSSKSKQAIPYTMDQAKKIKLTIRCGKSSIKGKKFVITGMFPSMAADGDTSGVDIGKDAVAKLITDAGGIVQSSVSSKTDYLVVGEAPGGAKWMSSINHRVFRMDLNVLKGMIAGDEVHTYVKVITADAFSKGVFNNGIGRKMAVQKQMDLSYNTVD